MKNSNCEVMAYDCRGHGSTYTSDDNDLSVETLVNDTINLVNFLYKEKSNTQIILVGHR